MFRKKIVTLLIAGIMAMGGNTCLGEFNIEENKGKIESQDKDHIESSKENKAYRYQENEGIFMFYETEDEELYRELLPEEFDMPDKMIVHLFVMDFYKIDSEADPYKEMSISLLAKYNDEEVWHCVYMPVTSEQSMIAGRVGLGLPKTIGDIKFKSEESSYTGTVIDDSERSANISLNTKDYTMSETEEKQIKELMSLPKINILNGEAIQMTRAGGTVNIIDVAKRFPKRVKIQGGEATISFDETEDTKAHPFGLKPTNVIAAYFLHNEIPFSLGRK